jgi:hypothetical protein
LLAGAVAESIDTATPIQEVLPRMAYQAGRTIGADADNLLVALEEAGYEPRRSVSDPHQAQLRPFDGLAGGQAPAGGVRMGGARANSLEHERDVLFCRGICHQEQDAPGWNWWSSPGTAGWPSRMTAAYSLNGIATEDVIGCAPAATTPARTARTRCVAD